MTLFGSTISTNWGEATRFDEKERTFRFSGLFSAALFVARVGAAGPFFRQACDQKSDRSERNQAAPSNGPTDL